MDKSASERRRRDLVRTEVSLRAVLLRPGSADVPVRVRNLSSAGFMAESFQPVPAGSKVTLSLAGIGELPAEIRWNNGFWMGGLFDFEVSARELGAAVAHPGEPGAVPGGW